MEDMAKWQYQEGFKMLIVCDSAATYGRLRMDSDEFHALIDISTKSDVTMATGLV
eukprot:CAMPEP_0168752572 /NCGR_PEP_ID=MMETSP0724-20121128/18463_1 /TAXON_ID=265536 /ORGANISM="Amphiprora sp., Strain CCMP467" /LENGTH=54 /DNA_ID=CAMNT_0008800841 /DNA_START=368 /DNA_END=529 /DNA_ORIENTATION=-